MVTGGTCVNHFLCVCTHDSVHTSHVMHPSLTQFLLVMMHRARKTSMFMAAAASMKPNSEYDKQYAVSSIAYLSSNGSRFGHGRCPECWGRVHPKSPDHMRMSHRSCFLLDGSVRSYTG